MRFALLGSGSEGNALVVQTGHTTLLVDCGFSLRETEARLSRLGLAAAGLSGILVTHEHGDHVSGVARLARRYSLSVWLTHGTLLAQEQAFAGLDITEIDSHCAFSVAGMQVLPYPVPHDAREPVQFVLGDGARRLGVLTDAGHATQHVVDTLYGCDALVLECNHDETMLAEGSYPWHLKQRVGGQYGHLSNAAAAALLARLDHGRMQHVVAAHLSRKNNLPKLASAALADVIGDGRERVGLATQDEVTGWLSIA